MIRRWRLVVVGIAFVALLVRFAILLHYRHYVSADLRIYYYFSHLILEGANPYDAPAGGSVDSSYGDFPAPEMGTYAALLNIHDSPLTLKVFFAFADFLTIILLGFLLPRSKPWRLSAMLFYGFSPLVLVSWIVVTEDKTVLFTFITWIYIAIERRATIAAWLGTGTLAVYKWISGFFLVPFALWSSRSMSRKGLLAALGIFAITFVVSHIPYFPESLRMYERRQEASHIYPPVHASLTKVLYDLGLYETFFVQGFIYTALAAVYLLFALRKIDIKEAIALSLFAAYVALPNESFDRILLITLPFLFVVSLSLARWAAVWAVTIVTGAGVYLNVMAPTPVPQSFVDAAGSYGSYRHLILANALMLLILAFYLWDKIVRRRPLEEDLLAPRLELSVFGRSANRRPFARADPPETREIFAGDSAPSRSDARGRPDEGIRG